MRARLVIALTALTLPVLLHGQSSDTMPPVLTDFSLSPTSADVSAGPQTIDFTAKATDDLSGVDYGFVYLRGPSSQFMFGYLGITGGTGPERILNGAIPLLQYSQPGSWVVELYLYDRAGNQSFFSPDVLATLGYQNTVTVASDPADSAGPTLADIEIAPASIDVSSGGQNITVRYYVKDDLAGALFAPPPGYQSYLGWGVFAMSPSGKQDRFTWATDVRLVSGDANDGWWEGTVTLPRYSEPGQWRIYWVDLQDLAANRRFYSQGELASLFGSKVQFTVASSPSDTVGPTLISLDYSPKFLNTSEGSQNVTVTVRASDDLAGLLFGPTTPEASYWESGLQFRSPSGSQYRGVCCWGPFNLVAGDLWNGTWQFSIFFPQFSEQGTWKVDRLDLKDAVRNKAVFFSNQLEALLQPTELVIVKPSLVTDGTISDPAGGGTVQDETFGTRAQVTAPPGVLSEPTSVSIDVFPDPIGVPPPTGFQAEGTLFVNIQLIPAPSYPLPAPGLTVVLPLTSARIPGSSLHLFRVNPSTGLLEAAVGVDGNPVIGTVNGPDGLSATFARIARLSTVVGLVPNAIPVSIDIAPGSSTNPINTKSGGVIPVAVLGSASFNVQAINVTKLWFGPANAKPAHNLSEPLTYASHLQDVNGDGFTDLVLHFPQRDTGLNAGTTNACLYGENVWSTPLIGCDSVKIVQ